MLSKAAAKSPSILRILPFHRLECRPCRMFCLCLNTHENVSKTARERDGRGSRILLLILAGSEIMKAGIDARLFGDPVLRPRKQNTITVIMRY